MSAVSFFSIEPSSSGSSGSVHELPSAPSAIELDDMPIGGQAVYHGPLTRPKSAVTRASTYHEVDRTVPAADEDDSLKTPGDLELSRPPSPQLSGMNATDVAQTWNNPSMNKWRLLAACLFCLANGCNDSAVSIDRQIPEFKMLIHTAWSTTAIHRGILPHRLCHRFIDLHSQRCWLHPCGILRSCN
jgi:hypothetical protein